MKILSKPNGNAREYGRWAVNAYLPFILDIPNTMTKEAKEIEKMNQQIKSRRK